MTKPLNKNHPRAKARARGRTRYLGTCRVHGTTEFYTSAGTCCLCISERNEAKGAAYWAERSKEFRQKNPGYMAEYRAKKRAAKTTA
jgi:hypothetical protein